MAKRKDSKGRGSKEEGSKGRDIRGYRGSRGDRKDIRLRI